MPLLYTKNVELYTSKGKIKAPYFEYDGNVVGASTVPTITNKTAITVDYPIWCSKAYNSTSIKNAFNRTRIDLNENATAYLKNESNDSYFLYNSSNTLLARVTTGTTNSNIGYAQLIGVVHDTNDHYTLVGIELRYNYYGETYGNASVVAPTNTSFGYVVWDNFDSTASFGTQMVTDNTSVTLITNGVEYQDYSTDPYTNGGTTEPGGGTGDFDDTSDPINFPPLPSIGAMDTGFISLFNPTLSELKALAQYMWTNPLFDVSAWKKIFADPMDAILGLSIIPVAVPDGGTKAITVGNIATDVSATVAAQQYIEIQCGTINLNEYWGAYLDYSPYTKVEIYLPYCGTHQLNTDDVMNKTIEVRYHIDILSGACCAYVKCGDSVLYTFIGQCSSSIPISSGDFTNVINGVLTAATAIGTMVATGGASAPLSIPALANSAVNDMKPNVEKSGALSGTGGMMAIQKPYIILTRPRQALPEEQSSFMGYPSFINATLSDLSGYTEIEKIHLSGVPATESELQEIEALLKQGVIL